MVNKELTDIQRWVELFDILDDAGGRLCPMPDEAMNAITEACNVLSDAIIATEVTCKDDIVAKFEHAAKLISDETGERCNESEAVFDALKSLAKFRNDREIEEGFGPHDAYSQFA